MDRSRLFTTFGSDLNPTEAKVLAELIESSAGNGHDFGFVDDIECVSLAQRSGYVSSLVRKGYWTTMENMDGDYGEMGELTERAKALIS